MLGHGNENNVKFNEPRLVKGLANNSEDEEMGQGVLMIIVGSIMATRQHANMYDPHRGIVCDCVV